MPRSVTLKTKKHDQGVYGHIASLDTNSQKNAKSLLAIFTKATGTTPKLWGDSIIGFGEYHYTYDSGREGDFLATGFAVRKNGPTIYIMPGYENYSDILKTIGVPYKLGKSCLYLKHLDGLHTPKLTKLIKAGLKDLKKRYPVTMQ